MKLIAIVVLYKPDIRAVIKNILSYIDQIDHLLLYRNSEVGEKDFTLLHSYFDKIDFIGSGKNVGIAKALNEGAKWAEDQEFSHLLTLDQDSYFEGNNLKNFRHLISNDNVKNVGIYSANPDNRGQLTFKTNSAYIRIPDAITSGSIFPIKIFGECGYFDENLFIDAVDYDYCYRIKKLKNYDTIVFPSIILKHEVGYPTKINFGLITDNYSSFRTYYIIRNHIIIWRRYPDLFQQQYKKTLIKIHIVYRIAKIIIGEEDKLNKLKSIVTGLKDGLFIKAFKN
ncbi:glycosyltransferase [Pedobacter sp. MR2016-24]|uniref:glycosyltransferase n=1 Tax=Pedobacter sp. MR2016-24 TaxID=2994466 RepID=UPI0022477E50|nr:glycosyltransferase [Pedobacter sp. MR2016-24]MCX2485257.1 glycosyltransferase [Pedobacter sp. MR2016-24]